MGHVTREHRPLILASASPRRRELMALLGVPFRVVPADIDELLPGGLPPEWVAVTLAREKALAIAQSEQNGIVLGADTIVVCQGEVLGKPRDANEAMQMLSQLNGREHQVLTGVVLLEVVDRSVVREQSDVVRTRVWFRQVGEDHLRRYIATGEPIDKAGAYGAQGYGSTLIERIEGCYFNVVGLPVSRVCAMLEAWGVTPLDMADGQGEQNLRKKFL